MKLRFDANQEFQLQAIEAVTSLFAGQPRIETDLHVTLGQSSFAAVANRLDLSEAKLLDNLHAVQRQNGIAPDPDLICIEERIETAVGVKDVRFYNLRIKRRGFLYFIPQRRSKGAPLTAKLFGQVRETVETIHSIRYRILKDPRGGEPQRTSVSLLTLFCCFPDS